MDEPATENKIDIQGGNIVAPHGNSGKKASSAELQTFTAETQGQNVLLTWETNSEINVKGFDLYSASESDGPWDKINSALITDGTKNPTVHRYRWIAKKSGKIDSLWYRLDWVSVDNLSEILGITSYLPPRVWIPIISR